VKSVRVVSSSLSDAAARHYPPALETHCPAADAAADGVYVFACVQISAVIIDSRTTRCSSQTTDD